MPRNVTTVAVYKVCPVCGKGCETIVDAADYSRWVSGAYVQDVWPHKDAEWRERLVSGTHGKCWKWMFPDEEG